MPEPLRRFLHAADLHLTGSRPRCRQDSDWLETQRSMLRFLVDTANAHQVSLHLGGDIFDHARVATEVVNMAIRELKRVEHGIYALIGNHDAPFHDPSRIHEASLGTLLETFPHTPCIPGIQDAAPFGRDCPTGAPVAFTHQLVFEDESKRPPMAKGHTAQSLLEAFPDAKWIFTGDYHARFHVEIGGRHVVNPGCALIHNSSMIGEQAFCALVDIDAESVEWIEIPDDASMVSDVHLRTVEARESRVGAFLERVKGAGGVVLDFRANLDAAIQQLDPKSKTYKALVRIKDRAQEVEK
jgi:hypothetical protein